MAGNDIDCVNEFESTRRKLSDNFLARVEIGPSVTHVFASTSALCRDFLCISRVRWFQDVDGIACAGFEFIVSMIVYLLFVTF